MKTIIRSIVLIGTLMTALPLALPALALGVPRTITPFRPEEVLRARIPETLRRSFDPRAANTWSDLFAHSTQDDQDRRWPELPHVHVHNPDRGRGTLGGTPIGPDSLSGSQWTFTLDGGYSTSDLGPYHESSLTGNYMVLSITLSTMGAQSIVIGPEDFALYTEGGASGALRIDDGLDPPVLTARMALVPGFFTLQPVRLVFDVDPIPDVCDTSAPYVLQSSTGYVLFSMVGSGC